MSIPITVPSKIPVKKRKGLELSQEVNSCKIPSIPKGIKASNEIRNRCAGLIPFANILSSELNNKPTDIPK